MLFFTPAILLCAVREGNHLKGFPPWRIRDDASNSDKNKLPRVRKTNLLKSSKISLNKQNFKNAL